MPVTASIKLLPEYHTYGREQKKSATINDSGFGAGASTNKVKITTQLHLAA